MNAAKQKAMQLVDRYFEYVEANSSQGQIDNAKMCALIAVNELIGESLIENINYWREVKQEIQSL